MRELKGEIVEYYLNINLLLGKTLKSISTEGVGGDRIEFLTNDGEKYLLYHNQDCCEYVTIEDICGDLDDLIGTPITLAEEVTSNDNPPDVKPETIEYQDSFTWTFYRLATAKGFVTIRWYGSSNGYYSESVDFVKMDGGD